jgi:hypothetical protein
VDGENSKTRNPKSDAIPQSEIQKVNHALPSRIYQPEFSAPNPVTVPASLPARFYRLHRP